ncbi:polyketide synthase docking domain-containing protein, partial [Nonomuraea sp. NPDC055795]
MGTEEKLRAYLKRVTVELAQARLPGGHRRRGEPADAPRVRRDP